MNLETTKQAINEVLSYAEQIRKGYSMTVSVSETGYARAYINKQSPEGRVTLATIAWRTDTAEKAEEFAAAVDNAIADNGAYADEDETEN